MSRNTLYTALPDKEGADALLLEDGTVLRGKRPAATSSQRVHWIIHGVSIATILLLGFSLDYSFKVTREKCWNMFNYRSPVNEAVYPFPHVERHWNGSLWYPHRWNGPPTPEVNDAWFDILQYGMISVTLEDIEAVGHDEYSAKFPDEVGGGYIAATIGSHQLHCLHWMWEDHYIDYVPAQQHRKKVVPELYELHFEHCANYIRESLMCNFDTGLIPYNWVLDHQNPTPNAWTVHKCVDWDNLQDWLKDRAVPMPDGFQWHQPADAHSLGWNP